MLNIIIRDNFHKYVYFTETLKKYMGDSFYKGSEWHLSFSLDVIEDHLDFIEQISGLPIELFWIMLRVDNTLRSEYYEISLYR